MKQYQYNKAVWRKTDDDTVFLRDARGLLGSDPEGGMTPITEHEYHKIDWNESPEKELEQADSEECLQAMIKYFADHQKG